MKFLIDTQLPIDLKIVLQEFNCNCLHVNSLPNQDKSSDLEVRAIADAQGRIVISKDFDFYYSHAAINSPKKLLIVTTGNSKNKALFDLFKRNIRSISSPLKVVV